MIEVTSDNGAVTCRVSGTLSTLLSDIHCIGATIAKAVLDCARSDAERLMVLACVTESFADAVPTALNMLMTEQQNDNDSERLQVTIDMNAVRELLKRSRGIEDDDDDESDNSDN